MKFLEKDLETIIYHHTLACCQRGLDIKPHGQAGTLLRQVALGPYGTADLIMLDMDVSPVYAPWEEEGQTFKRSLTITIIECKLEEINTRAYQQAKRYKAALKKLTEYYSSYHTEFVFKVVLIGQTTDRSSDFLFQYMDDPDCSAFTFDYSVDGIQFYPVSKEWIKGQGATEAMHLQAEQTIKTIFRDAIVKHWNTGLPEESHYSHTH